MTSALCQSASHGCSIALWVAIIAELFGIIVKAILASPISPSPAAKRWESVPDLVSPKRNRSFVAAEHDCFVSVEQNLPPLPTPPVWGMEMEAYKAPYAPQCRGKGHRFRRV